MKKSETFQEMVDRLKAEGLLDENGGMTSKGHDYVEKVKRDLVREQARVMAELAAEERGEVNEIWDCAEAA